MIVNVDPQGPTWRALKREMETRIAEMQNSLETCSEMIVINRIQGRIAALREVIDDVERAEHPT